MECIGTEKLLHQHCFSVSSKIPPCLCLRWSGRPFVGSCSSPRSSPPRPCCAVSDYNTTVSSYFHISISPSYVSYVFWYFCITSFCSAFLSVLNQIQQQQTKNVFRLSPRDVFLILDFHPPPRQDDRVLLAVAEVEEHPGWTLSHWNIQTWHISPNRHTWSRDGKAFLVVQFLPVS